MKKANQLFQHSKATPFIILILALIALNLAGFYAAAQPTVKVVVVAGGGAGGGDGANGSRSGGGGAGGYQYNASLPVAAQGYTITVGNGGGSGSIGAPTYAGNNGQNSSFSTLITATGGGGGASGVGGTNSNGRSGGCGGGASANQGPGNGGTGSQGGNGGGASSTAGYPGSGGGGGASANGGDALDNNSGVGAAGGAGIANPIVGSTSGQNVSGTYYLAGGGGGAGDYRQSATTGGGGNGGGGGGNNTGVGVAGTANTGGGGGGGGIGYAGGVGGSGIVIISFPANGSSGVSTASTGGNTVATVGANRIHTFTTGGTFTVILASATVTTQAVSQINETTATGNGNVTSDGGAAITERGVVWNTSTLPTTANSKATSAGTTGAFTASMTGLTGNTLYYVRAYATNAAGTTYGNEVTFTTTSPTPVTIDWNNSNVQEITLTGGRSFNFTNGKDGGYYTLIIKQNATGNFACSWPAYVRWAAGSAPSLTQTANAVAIIRFVYDGTNFYEIGISQY